MGENGRKACHCPCHHLCHRTALAIALNLTLTLATALTLTLATATALALANANAVAFAFATATATYVCVRVWPGGGKKLKLLCYNFWRGLQYLGFTFFIDLVLQICHT